MLIALWGARPGVALAEGQVVEEARIESARGLALGAGLRAAARGSHAQADNPAQLGEGGTEEYEALASYYGASDLVGSGASVVDSVHARVGVGASGRGLFSRASGRYAGWESRLGGGVGVPNRGGGGVGGRFSNLTITDKRARPEHRVTGEAPADRTFFVRGGTFDLGVTYHLNRDLHFALVGTQWPPSGSPLIAPAAVASFAAGVGRSLTLGADLALGWSAPASVLRPRLTVGAGGEYVCLGQMPLRAGYRYDQLRAQHVATAGIGYSGARFGADLGARSTLAGMRETTLVFSLRFTQERRETAP